MHPKSKGTESDFIVLLLPFYRHYFHFVPFLFQDDPFFSKFKKLNEAICGVIENYSLVSFIALDIEVNPVSFTFSPSKKTTKFCVAVGLPFCLAAMLLFY
jgi:hypothetical protein